ncbi:MAG: NADH-quinone oxidoreductase subunit M, partial [Alphaproteobacteria bacterium]|nr:NADH-quinone oxidoreductase subunit M [Alphaproteobacteria bacterium]
VNSWVAFLATTGTILSAAYALYLYRRIIFGVLDKPSLASILDLSWREKIQFAPLVALTILYGVYPAPVIASSSAAINALIKSYETALNVTKMATLTVH